MTPAPDDPDDGPASGGSTQPVHPLRPEPIEETLDPSDVNRDFAAAIYQSPPQRIEAPAVPMPSKRIRLATYRPRRASRGVVALGVALIAGATVATVLFIALHDRNALPTPTTVHRGGLVVQGVSISTDPAVPALHCPTKEITYVATVSTNGRSGVLEYQWTTPAGSPQPVRKTRIRTGQTSATGPFVFTFHDPAQGSAIFHVLRPTPSDTTSPLTTYACP
jgi:hypothetical protein